MLDSACIHDNNNNLYYPWYYSYLHLMQVDQ